MITSVRLREWRNYRDATVSFFRGTTFVVAANGVGKTSLVEAARFALFGQLPPGDRPVRVDAETATISLDLRLPDGRLLAIERTLSRAGRIRPPTIAIDGQPLRDPEPQLTALLQDAYGCSPLFLERVAMPPRRDELHDPAALRLADHLGALYGMDRIDTALAQLTTLTKTLARQIDNGKTQLREADGAITTLETSADAASHLAQERATQLTTARALTAAARTNLAYQRDLARWREDVARIGRERHGLAESLTQATGRSVDPGSLLEVLDETLGTLEKDIAEATRAGQRAAALAEVLQDNLNVLDDAGHDCPVCRRPLDAATIRAAHSRTESEVAELATTATAHADRAAALTQQHATLTDLRTRARTLTPPPPPPPVPENQAEGMPTVAEAEAAEHLAAEAAIDARRARDQARAALEQAQQDQRQRDRLENLYQHEALLQMATATLKESREELLTGTLTPLAEQLEELWGGLFPRRGTLATRVDGSLTRRIAGAELPFDSFSTAESTAAVLLLRVLVATMTTRIDFIWFDEPLEHLDPTLRRSIANTLAQITGNKLSQVVVTTYEEPLASRLAERGTGEVQLRYVRPDQADQTS